MSGDAANGRESAAKDARHLVRGALKGALATLDRTTGHPYASLVTVATDLAGRPILLLSRLALHTQNADADQRASLMIDGTAPDGDPLAGGRVTLIGKLARIDDPLAADRFQRRHPAARQYAAFGDFGFFALAVERAHFVGGFGRIVPLLPRDIVLEMPAEAAFAAGERLATERANRDDAAEIARITAAEGGNAAPWVLAGFDPEGFDLIGGGRALRASLVRRLDKPENFALTLPHSLSW